MRSGGGKLLLVIKQLIKFTSGDEGIVLNRKIAVRRPPRISFVHVELMALATSFRFFFHHFIEEFANFDSLLHVEVGFFFLCLETTKKHAGGQKSLLLTPDDGDEIPHSAIQKL